MSTLAVKYGTVREEVLVILGLMLCQEIKSCFPHMVQFFSGVWAAGTHGPEGWPNWRADPGAPIPTADAHCLIGRFGNGPWFKVGSLWSGKNETGTTGRLQLNINDNNPYNGDPNQRFTVSIQVTRQNAAAAGLYI